MTTEGSHRGIPTPFTDANAASRDGSVRRALYVKVRPGVGFDGVKAKVSDRHTGRASACPGPLRCEIPEEEALRPVSLARRPVSVADGD